MGIPIWLYELVRPKLTHVYVTVYEKNREKDISIYDEHRLQMLIKAIESLWIVPQGTPYWFEAECFETCSCFQKRQTFIQVSCYTQDIVSSKLKKPMAIPIRYRKKLFDKILKITPQDFGSLVWPSEMFVQFHAVKRT